MKGNKLEYINYRKDSFELEDVCYCDKCCSLAIRSVGGYSYCDQCGSTELKETNIFNWEQIYKQKYGKRYIEQHES